jgi:hypothetical protein
VVGVWLALLSLPGAALAAWPVPVNTVGTLFVSPSGSDGNGGRSFGDAFASIGRAASVARPGDVIAVAPGTYHGGIVTSASGTAGHRITFVSVDPLGARIDGSGHDTAWRNNGDYVDIVGFDVSGSDYLGIFNMGSYVRVIGNEVHNLAAPSCNSPNGGAGIDHGNYSGTGDETIGNIVHDIIPPGPHCSLIHGIYHSNKGGRIVNNIVYRVADTGIETWHAATGVTITNNLVFDAYVGIVVAGDTVVGDNYLVANNILLDNTYGIAENGSKLGTHNRYLNNLLHGNTHDSMLSTGQLQGTLFTPPQLVDFRSDGSGNYHLAPGSAAIDAGTATGAPTTDIDGTPRPQGNAVDIGPYEAVQP